MLRLTDLRLPLDHPGDALPAAVAARLGIPLAALARVDVVKRSHDVRNKRAPVFIYTLDVEVDASAAGIAPAPGGGDRMAAVTATSPRKLNHPTYQAQTSLLRRASLPAQ